MKIDSKNKPSRVTHVILKRQTLAKSLEEMQIVRTMNLI